MPSVLLTRPQTTSAHLAKELQRQGYQSIIEPLLMIVASNAQRPALNNLQASIITSTNALTALEEGDYDLNRLLDLPCFCVGPRTADKARAYGFTKVLSSDNDGAALVQLIAKTLNDKNMALLHIAGRDTDSKIQDGLQSANFQVIAWPVYAAEAMTQLTAGTIDLIKQGKLDTILVFSARTAATLNKLILQYELEVSCASVTAIGLSAAVTDVLKTLPWQKVIAASQPTEDAVIHCLKETLPVS